MGHHTVIVAGQCVCVSVSMLYWEQGPGTVNMGRVVGTMVVGLVHQLNLANIS